MCFQVSNDKKSIFLRSQFDAISIIVSVIVIIQLIMHNEYNVVILKRKLCRLWDLTNVNQTDIKVSRTFCLIQKYLFEIFKDIRNVRNRVVILKVYSSNFRDAHYIIVELCKTKIERVQSIRNTLITSKILLTISRGITFFTLYLTFIFTH